LNSEVVQSRSQSAASDFAQKIGAVSQYEKRLAISGRCETLVTKKANDGSVSADDDKVEK
jgi:hypothetical protein